MNTVSLYHAAQAVQNQIALCVDEDGALDTDKLDMIEATFKDRAVAVIAVYKGKGHTVEMLESYLAEIKNQIEREKKNQERLKDYLQACMKITGVQKITSDDGLLSATLYPERDEPIEIDEDAVFPPELCNDQKPPAPSKTKIKNAILEGQPVANARIVRKDRLTIR